MGDITPLAALVPTTQQDDQDASTLDEINAIAGLLITTEAMVAEKPEKKGPPMPPGGGGMGDMDF